MRKPWTRDEEVILRSAYPNGVDAACAALPGRTVQQIKTKAFRMRLRVSGEVLHRLAVASGKKGAGVRRMSNRRVKNSATAAAVLKHWTQDERLALFGRWVAG